MRAFQNQMVHKQPICNQMPYWLPGLNKNTFTKILHLENGMIGLDYKIALKHFGKGIPSLFGSLIDWGEIYAILINIVHELTLRNIGLKVLTGHGAAIDTTTPAGKLVFGIFAALAEFEREMIKERTIAGLASARARGRKGGRPYKMTTAKLRLAMAAMGNTETKIGGLCEELGITKQTLYRHVSPKGELRDNGKNYLVSNINAY